MPSTGPTLQAQSPPPSSYFPTMEPTGEPTDKSDVVSGAPVRPRRLRVTRARHPGKGQRKRESPGGRVIENAHEAAQGKREGKEASTDRALRDEGAAEFEGLPLEAREGVR